MLAQYEAAIGNDVERLLPLFQAAERSRPLGHRRVLRHGGQEPAPISAVYPRPGNPDQADGETDARGAADSETAAGGSAVRRDSAAATCRRPKADGPTTPGPGAAGDATNATPAIAAGADNDSAARARPTGFTAAITGSTNSRADVAAAAVSASRPGAGDSANGRPTRSTRRPAARDPGSRGSHGCGRAFSRSRRRAALAAGGNQSPGSTRAGPGRGSGGGRPDKRG